MLHPNTARAQGRAESPVNEQQIRTLHEGDFTEETRNIVLVGGPGTGKSHLGLALAIQATANGVLPSGQGCAEGRRQVGGTCLASTTFPGGQDDCRRPRGVRR